MNLFNNVNEDVVIIPDDSTFSNILKTYEDGLLKTLDKRVNPDTMFFIIAQYTDTRFKLFISPIMQQCINEIASYDHQPRYVYYHIWRKEGKKHKAHAINSDTARRITSIEEDMVGIMKTVIDMSLALPQH